MIRRAALCLAATLAACGNGALGEGRRLDLDGGQVDPGDVGPDSGVGPDANTTDSGFVADALPTDTGPISLGGATVGDRCLGGVSESYVVFSVDAPECATHGQAIEGRGQGGTIYALLTPPTQFPAQLALDATACFSGACGPTTVDLELTSFAVGTGAMGTYSLTLPDGMNRSGPLDAAWCDYPAGNPPPATGIRVVEVSMYQAVKIPLVQSAAPIGNRNAPVVADRPGRLRVFVEIDPGFRARPIVARLVLARPGMADVTLETQRLIERTSLDSNFVSTLDFDLDAAAIATDTQWSVTLYENDACTSEPGSSSGGRMPAQGNLALGAESANGGLEIVLVPVRYNADGSGRLPDTSQAMLDRYYDSVWTTYPLSDLTLTVHAPMDWNDAVQSNASGWSELLAANLALRGSDQPPRGTYYYAIINPADTFELYCPALTNCNAGLSGLPDANDNQGRGAVGLGFDRDGTFETFPHEMGHTHGRGHSGCQTPDADSGFPYTEGQDGVWGFDIVAGGFKSPLLRDVMGYCRPSWISDYTYRGLFARIQAVNLSAAIRRNDQMWRTVIADSAGLREGQPLPTITAPRGRPVSATFLGAGDLPLGPATAVRIPFADQPGSLIWIAPEPAGTVAIELEGYGRLSIH